MTTPLRQPPSIDAYGGGGFRVAGVRRQGSLLIVDDQAHAWPVTKLEDLTPEDFEAVLSLGPKVVEFVVLGAGLVQGLPPRSIRDAFAEARIGLEFMDTASAARLYNVLASEGRRLAAALIAI